MEFLRGIPILDYSLWRISRLSVLNEILVEDLIEQIKSKSSHAVHQEFKGEIAENGLINSFWLGYQKIFKVTNLTQFLKGFREAWKPSC